MTGRLIAFEGGEAAGKSTQVDRLAARIDALVTREPGGTPAGARIREVVLDPGLGELSARAETLLMAADRAQHADEILRPTLAAGRHVVSDRSLYSSIAYQAHARGLDADRVRDISLWALDGLVPDIVVLLDVPVDVARARLASTAPDRLEAKDDGFHERVRAGFLAQAAADPDRWAVVDATAGIDAVTDAVWAACVDHCPDLA